MRRTAVLAVAGWVAAAVAATAAGVAVLTVVGQSLVGSSPDQPWTQERIAEALAASATPAASVPPGAGATTTPAVAGPTPAGPAAASSPATAGAATLLETPGGTVIARCAGGRVTLRSWSPARGYAATDVRPGPDREARVTFERDGDGDDEEEIEARVTCAADGLPRLDRKRD